MLDKTLPTGGSVTINGGAPKTNSAAVTLQLTPATDDTGGSGVTHMGFSNTAALPATWLPVATRPPGRSMARKAISNR